MTRLDALRAVYDRLGESAVVNAQVTGNAIVIHGRVTGDVVARKHLRDQFRDPFEHVLALVDLDLGGTADRPQRHYSPTSR